MHQNSSNPAPTALDRCQMMKYCRLSSSTCTDCRSYGNIFCYCCCIWSTLLIRGLFHLDTSFSCWDKGMRVSFYVFWSLFSVYLGCRSTWRLQILESVQLKKLMEQMTRGQQLPQWLIQRDSSSFFWRTLDFQSVDFWIKGIVPYISFRIAEIVCISAFLIYM